MSAPAVVQMNDGRFSRVADALASTRKGTDDPICGGAAAIWLWVAQESCVMTVPPEAGAA